MTDFVSTSIPGSLNNDGPGPTFAEGDRWIHPDSRLVVGLWDGAAWQTPTEETVVPVEGAEDVAAEPSEIEPLDSDPGDTDETLESTDEDDASAGDSTTDVTDVE